MVDICRYIELVDGGYKLTFKSLGGYHIVA